MLMFLVLLFLLLLLLLLLFFQTHLQLENTQNITAQDYPDLSVSLRVMRKLPDSRSLGLQGFGDMINQLPSVDNSGGS